MSWDNCFVPHKSTFSLGFPTSSSVKMWDGNETDKKIEICKIEKVIKALEGARGKGISMFSLIVPPGDEISRVTKMLGQEFRSASNVMSGEKRQAVLGAITSARERLKLYSKVPPNGLVLYTGTIANDDPLNLCDNKFHSEALMELLESDEKLGDIVTVGGGKKVTIDFEPLKPIKASLYLFDRRFHTEALKELLECDDKFGYIVMDDNMTLFGTLSGNTRKVLYSFTVDLAKKHEGEKLQNYYARKTAACATHMFINRATSQPNVCGLVLAASADFKTESDMFDPRLRAKILNVVGVSQGGENGLDQAIELSSEILAKFIQEKHLIGKYFEEISEDTGKYVFGVDDTLKCLEMGAVETLIVSENLDISRYVLKNSTTGEIIIKHLEADQRDAETNAELQVEEKMSLLDWFANEYKQFGCTLEFVTNKSQEGSQFCTSFGGIGGILRLHRENCIQSDHQLPHGWAKKMRTL